MDDNKYLLIIKLLSKKIDSLLSDISSINTTINTKLLNIRKIQDYLNEYDNNNSFSMTKIIPSLNNNLYYFSNKLHLLISNELISLESIQDQKNKKLSELNSIRCEIEALTIYENQLAQDRLATLRRIEQVTIDEQSINRRIREAHE